jgi:hypothetical protein
MGITLIISEVSQEEQLEMLRRKDLLYMLFLIASLLFLAIDHRGIIIGDRIFRIMGVSPWSDHRNQGIHYSIIVGIVLALISGNILVKHLRIQYMKVGRKVVAFCIIFLLLFPIVSRWLMVIGNLNNSGVSALDYSSKDFTCEYHTNDGIVLFQCKIRLLNYGGNSETVYIKPVFQDNFNQSSGLASIELKYVELVIPPRSNRTYSMRFTSTPTNLTIFGATMSGGVSFESKGEKKAVFWK